MADDKKKPPVGGTPPKKEASVSLKQASEASKSEGSKGSRFMPPGLQFGKNPADKNHEEEGDIDYMPPISAALRRKPSKVAQVMLVSVTAFFLIAIIWARWAELDEVTRGDGRVIPSGQTKVVDHLEGGIVQDILIREGDIVEKGQILLKIDNTVAQAKYNTDREHYLQALISVRRLKAQLEDRPFKIPEDIEKEAPGVVAEERVRYESSIANLESEQNIASRDVEQKRQEFLELQGRLEQLEQQYILAKEELSITEPLANRGVVAKVDLIRLKREVNDVKGEIDSTKIAIPGAESALKQAEQRLKKVDIIARNETLKELIDAQRRLTESQGAITTEQDRVTRTEIRSPVRGTIKELLVNTIGGVVQPGEDLVAIVPLEDTLLIEAQVRPADVAFLRPGLPAIVKITAYDFAVYGGLEAELTQISADSIIDEEENSFFRIRLRTDRNYLGSKKAPLPIIPGMTASVDILTGKKTVWDYLFKPIYRGLSNALSER